MPKTYPRFERNLRRPNAAEMAKPLAPSLLEQLGAELLKPRREHERAAARYLELAVAMPLTQAAVKTATAEADAATRAAVRAGRQAPKAKLTAVADAEATLERTAAELEVVEELLGETATELLREATPHVRDAQAEVDRRREATLDAAHQRLVEAVELLEQAGLHAAEAAWLATLASTGSVPPHGVRGGSATAPSGLTEARHAARRLVEGRERQREGRRRVRARAGGAQHRQADRGRRAAPARAAARRPRLDASCDRAARARARGRRSRRVGVGVSR